MQSISCSLGTIGIGNKYYYTDCCGNFIFATNNTGEELLVSFDNDLVYAGVVDLSESIVTNCPTPTPTPTPSITPSNTPTPTITPTNTSTPTPSITPSITPSNSPVTRLKNDCDVITLFDMGISCNVVQIPTSENPLGGILSINVTGGTAPYTFEWAGGSRNQTLFGIPAGDYQIVVTDYSWPGGGPDYTASTICRLLGPTPTPTTTTTPTPTPTLPIQCVKLCMIITNVSGELIFGPTQFECNGIMNGQITWVSDNTGKLYYIIFDLIHNRWTVYSDSEGTTPLTIQGSIISSQVSQAIPTSGWNFLGGSEEGVINVTTGDCPDEIPLQVIIQQENSSCQGTKNCNGSIIMIAQNGVPPYQYSINGGVTYSTNSNFTNLCPNTYSVIVRDSLLNSTQTSLVTIGFDSTPTTYQLSLVNVGPATVTTIPNFSQTTTQLMNLVVTPPLPVGINVSFNLVSTSLITVNGPGSGTASVIWSVTKNNLPVNTIVGVETISQGTRPFCSPNIQTITTRNYNNSISITNGDVISITSTTVDSITNGQVAAQGNCATNINTQISATILTPTITGNDCNSVIPESRQVQVNDFTFVPTALPPSLERSRRSSTSVNPGDNACGLVVSDLVYIQTSIPGQISNGDRVFSDNGGVFPFNGGDNVWKLKIITATNNGVSVSISPLGFIGGVMNICFS